MHFSWEFCIFYLFENKVEKMGETRLKSSYDIPYQNWESHHASSVVFSVLSLRKDL